MSSPQPFTRWPLFRPFVLVILALCWAALPGALAAQADSTAARVRDVEQQLAALKAQVAQLQAAIAAAQAAELSELSRKLDVLAGEVERLKLGEAASAPVAAGTAGAFGMAPAASKVYATAHGISIGGYGELLYQSFADRDQSGAAAGKTDEIDLLRGVFYVGYKFNDRFVFDSEIEFEHSGSSDAHEEGEAGIEFAYVDYLARPAVNGRAGLLLLPVGFLNELHEPPIFLGARRSDVEQFILPTTWRSPGLGIFGGTSAWSYRAYLVNGLDASRFTPDGGIRESRESLAAKARAEDFAWVGRLDYVGTPGLLVGASAYSGDSGQGLRDDAGRRIGARTSLFEAHAEWKWRGARLRALGARGSIGDSARLNQALGFAGEQAVGSEQQGGYLEAGYDLFAAWPRGAQSLTPFVRLEAFDTQHRVEHRRGIDDYERDPANNRRIFTLGLQYKPIDPLVVKVDWQRMTNEARTGVNQLNVALGYIF